MKRTRSTLLIALILISISFCGCLRNGDDDQKKVRQPFIFRSEGNDIEVLFDVSDGMIRTFKDGRWEEVLLKGVNIGMGKPGYFPGEAAITKDEYGRWFDQIGEMNANVIRVYTVQPPGFYEALYNYNQRSIKPLYLLHGVWMRDDTFHSYPSVFQDVVSEEFMESMRTVVDVVHGNVEIEPRPGYAHGKFRSDVSDHLMGYVIGVEWDAPVVISTNEEEKGRGDLDGRFIKTENASPFEIWLAMMMDHIISYENDRYKEQRPLSFVNWVTTDKLSHPSEPLKREDLVSIDPDNITSKEDHYPSLFASYHIYPYYPDFMNYDIKLNEYIDHRGENNSYAGYLHDMVNCHKTPIVVAEFGIPTSRAMTHWNVYGYHQGNMTEKEQGEALIHLFEDIVEEGCAGGLLFAWQDEWFKRTWNTMDYMDPERRPYWKDAQTCEQNFGILSFDPGEKTIITLDGEFDDWGKVSSKCSEEMKFKAGPLKRIKTTSDEAFLYFCIELEDENIDWKSESFSIYLDTIPESGINSPLDDGITFSTGMDFRINITGPDTSKVMIDSNYDIFHYMYANLLGMIPIENHRQEKDNGIFTDIYYCINRELFYPELNETRPLEKFNTGHLRWGISDPISNEFDSNADIHGPGEDNIIEMRIPWLLLGAKDPSNRKFTGDLWNEGLDSQVEVEGFNISVVCINDESDPRIVTCTYPGSVNGRISSEEMLHYSWEKWDLPSYHERLKSSYPIVKSCFGRY
jgi:hypothetical protein